MRTAILPSAFLPSLAYESLASALRARAGDALVASAGEVRDGPAPVLEAYRAHVARTHPDVVVAHSNAGRYAVAAAGGAPVVYVDAALPPERGEATLAPEAALGHLERLADDAGLLPPWTRWWSEDDIAAVVPDRRALEAIRAVEPRLPLSYVRGRLGAPRGWETSPQAYLAFGDTYAAEVRLARRLGWPTRVLPEAAHLHLLVDPDAVAEELLTLAELVLGT